MASAPPLKVGLIGYGYAGRTFHAPLISAVPGLALAAVASSDAAKVRSDLPEVIVYARPEELLADINIDLVVVATPNVTHAPLALAALNAGKHVVVDKPFALDLVECRHLIGVSETVGRNLWVFHNRRWDSDYLTIRAAIEAGIIGEVTHFESKIERFRPEVRDRWRERDEAGAGIWYDLGPHLIDQALQLFGLPETVFASIARQRIGVAIDDWAHAVLTYGKRRVILQASMLAAGGWDRFVVHGTGGTLVKHAADPQEAQLLTNVQPGSPGWGDDADPLMVFDNIGQASRAAIGGDQRRFYQLAVASIVDRGPDPVKPIEALAVMAVLEAGIQSAREGRAVSPSLTTQERSALSLAGTYLRSS